MLLFQNKVGSSFLKSSEFSKLCTAYVDLVNNGCDLGNLSPFTDIEKVVARTLEQAHVVAVENPEEMKFNQDIFTPAVSLHLTILLLHVTAWNFLCSRNKILVYFIQSTHSRVVLLTSCPVSK